MSDDEHPKAIVTCGQCHPDALSDTCDDCGQRHCCYCSPCDEMLDRELGPLEGETAVVETDHLVDDTVPADLRDTVLCALLTEASTEAELWPEDPALWTREQAGYVLRLLQSWRQEEDDRASAIRKDIERLERRERALVAAPRANAERLEQALTRWAEVHFSTAPPAKGHTYHFPAGEIERRRASPKKGKLTLVDKELAIPWAEKTIPDAVTTETRVNLNDAKKYFFETGLVPPGFAWDPTEDRIYIRPLEDDDR